MKQMPAAAGTDTGPVRMAYVLDGPARGRSLTGEDVAETLRDTTLGWAHLDARHPQAAAWVADHLSYLDETVVEALTAAETRPRATPVGPGLLVNLRGINLNEGRDREDMVAVRIWADGARIVTLSRQRVRALEDIAAAVAAGEGPATAGEFVSLLAERLTARLEPFVAEIDAEVDGLEPEVIEAPRPELRRRIVELRLSVVELRRHVPPQGEALRMLAQCGSALFVEHDLRVLQEAHDDLTRIAENLDELRDNLAVLRDELAGQLSDRLNRHMYTLSIISGVFLPLGFLTGLFGINLGGMPGAANPDAFWIFSGILGVILAIQGLILWRLHWM